MRTKKTIGQELGQYNEEIRDGNGNKHYYAFIDSIEAQDNGRFLVQFEGVKKQQIDELNSTTLSFNQYEHLETAVIIGDYSAVHYQELRELFKEGLDEGSWVVLELTNHITRFRVTEIPEYVAEGPSLRSKYLGDGCTDVGNSKKGILESIFYMDNDVEKFINKTRLTILEEIFNRSTYYKNPVRDVAVYNVGQGSMNAALDRNGIPLAYFDVGGGAYWHAFTYPIPNPIKLCFTKLPVIILSHWDIDHWWTFNKLIRTKAQDIPTTTWIVPYQHFGPIQSKFYQLLKDKGHEILIWNDEYQMPLQTPFGTIYKCKNDSINKNETGLVFEVDNMTMRILLPGDASYDIISPFIKGKYTGLVATHHGGKNISDLANFPVPYSDKGKIVYSFGSGNRYHHPIGESMLKHIAVGWKNILATPDGSVSFMGIEPRGAPCRRKCDLIIKQVF